MSLKMDKSDGRLQAVMRPGMNWIVVLSAALLLLIVFGAGVSPILTQIQFAVRHGSPLGGLFLRLIVILALGFFPAYGLVSMLFSSELMIVTETDTEIQRRLFAYTTFRQSFPNSTIENLRYDEWSGGKAGMQNAIRFEAAGKTITFASQLATGDSWDLIDAMCTIYKFPTKEDADDSEPERSPAVTDW
ncbi:MAG TPA: hypothetical protein VN151_10450 [Terracidiphilus sp.]|nr:hypothetical protein [Terracidiphilus sp.]